MCSCVQQDKEHLGSGNFKYTFNCTMSDGTSKKVSVTSGNDSQALQLAELECEEKSLKFISSRNETILKNNTKFIVEVLEDAKGNEFVKTYVVDNTKNIHPKSVTVTCSCHGLSETKVCSVDGWCDCSGDKPKVVCE